MKQICQTCEAELESKKEQEGGKEERGSPTIALVYLLEYVWAINSGYSALEEDSNSPPQLTTTAIKQLGIFWEWGGGHGVTITMAVIIGKGPLAPCPVHRVGGGSLC